MGESHRYEASADAEAQPTLEESAQAIDAQAEKQAEEAQQPMTYSEEDTRPEWLPEKFANVEEMAKAYGELESKMGAQPKEEETTEQETTDEEVTYQDAINYASEEYAEKGELSEETYKALEEGGLSRLMVDNYIAGQQAILNQQQMEITNEIGGMQEYTKMSNWAAEHLSDEDLEAYNQTVESGSVQQAKFAIKSLYKQFQQAGAPSIAQGSVNGTGVPPFGSRAQVTAAMADKRYDTDPAYRDEVLKRLARSNV